MGILSFLTGGDSAGNGSQGGQRSLLVDGHSLCAAQSGNNRPRPQDQAQLLKRLANYADREELSVTVTFDSRPLRESGEGENFKGVTTHYTNNDDSIGMVLARLYRKMGSPVVVTSSHDTEEKMKTLTTDVMSAITLKKAIDSALGKPKQNNTTRRSKRPTTQKRTRQQQKPKAQEDPILDLIDPL